MSHRFQRLSICPGDSDVRQKGESSTRTGEKYMYASLLCRGKSGETTPFKSPFIIIKLNHKLLCASPGVEGPSNPSVMTLRLSHCTITKEFSIKPAQITRRRRHQHTTLNNAHHKPQVLKHNTSCVWYTITYHTQHLHWSLSLSKTL